MTSNGNSRVQDTGPPARPGLTTARRTGSRSPDIGGLTDNRGQPIMGSEVHGGRVRCSICGGPQDTPLCRWCGSEVLGDETIALTLSPAAAPAGANPEAVAGLLLLPGMEEDPAARLAAKGSTLDTFLAAALPRRAVLHGVHHGMALALSLDTLDETVAVFSTLAECSVCGSAVREEDLACATCGTGVYLGESLTEIREMLSAAEAGPSDGRGLEELPAGFRRARAG